MGRRSGRVLVFVALVLVVACGHTSQEPSFDSIGPLIVGPSDGPAGPVHATPRQSERILAEPFARAMCEYDTRVGGATSFLALTASLTSRAEQDRLLGSARAHLPWRILRARSERTSLALDGVSATGSTVFVNGVLTTTTSFATVQSYVRLTLTVADGRVVWADGDCL